MSLCLTGETGGKSNSREGDQLDHTIAGRRKWRPDTGMTNADCAQADDREGPLLFLNEIRDARKRLVSTRQMGRKILSNTMIHSH